MGFRKCRAIIVETSALKLLNQRGKSLWIYESFFGVEVGCQFENGNLQVATVVYVEKKMQEPT